jgi:hypothetical protein
VVVGQAAARYLVELAQVLAHCLAQLAQMVQPVDNTAVAVVELSIRKATRPELAELVLTALYLLSYTSRKNERRKTLGLYQRRQS